MISRRDNPPPKTDDMLLNDLLGSKKHEAMKALYAVYMKKRDSVKVKLTKPH